MMTRAPYIIPIIARNAIIMVDIVVLRVKRTAAKSPTMRKTTAIPTKIIIYWIIAAIRKLRKRSLVRCRAFRIRFSICQGLLVAILDLV